MKPKLPRELLWADKKSIDEFLIEPINKKLYELYLEMDSGNISGRIPPYKVFNEAYYQCTKAVYLNQAETDIDELELDIKGKLGLKIAARTVFRLMYAIFALRDNNTKEIEQFKEQFDVFNFLMSNNKPYLEFIKQAKKRNGRQYIDLSPKPYPVEKLVSMSLFWPRVTCIFDKEAIRELVELWPTVDEKLYIITILEDAFNFYKDRGDLFNYSYGWAKRKVNVEQDLKELKREIKDSKVSTKVAESFEDPYKDYEKAKDEEILTLRSTIKDLKSIIERLKSEQNSKKAKKEQERSFTLGMMLDYCENHTNSMTGPTIISMLNLFLRDSGNSTPEERQRVDEVEHKILHPDYGDKVQGNKTSFGDNSNMLNFNLPENANIKQILSSLPDDMKESLINKLISKDNG